MPETSSGGGTGAGLHQFATDFQNSARIYTLSCGAMQSRHKREQVDFEVFLWRTTRNCDGWCDDFTTVSTA
jgi:hypothetical protein